MLSTIRQILSRRGFKNFRRTLRYYAILPLIAVFSRLPFRLARPLGRAAGTLGWLFAVKDRRRALENLRAAFGAEKGPGEIRRISREVFRNTAVNVLEILAVSRWPPEKVRRTFPWLEEGILRVCTDLADGGVGMTAHFGNWEVLGVLFGAFGPGHMVPLAKRIYFKKFQDLMERFRREARLEVIYTDESPRRLIQAIRDRKILGVLADQDLKVLNGIFVDFFGRPAYTSTMPVNLAMTTGTPLILCCLIRDGGRFEVLYRKIPLASTGDRQEDLLENTQRWTKVLEEEIRRLPEQWVWFHRRWRTSPAEGPRLERRRRRGETSG